MKIGFYLLGKKGSYALTKFIEVFGSDSVAFVEVATDSGVDEDCSSYIIELCRKNSINFSVRGIKENAIHQGADYFFAIGWRWIIKNSEKLIVFHDSLLPKYRGFSPLVNMLINGESKIGVTAIKATADYDKGDIVCQVFLPVIYPIKISEAIDKILPLYAELVVECSRKIQSLGELVGDPQDENLATYSLWRNEGDYFIDWNSSAGKIERFINSVGSPYAGAAAWLADRKVRIFNAEIIEDVIVENRDSFLGKVIFMTDGFPTVVCANGLLIIKELRSEENENLIGKIPFRSRFK
jgi:methionyl-tRNA formyltransferase